MPMRKVAERDDGVSSEDDLMAPPDKKTTKSRAPAKAGIKRKAPSKTTRLPLTDRTNVQAVDDAQEEVTKPKVKRAKTAQSVEEQYRQRRELSAVPETQREPSLAREIPQTQQRQYSSPRPATAKPATTYERARSTSVQPVYPPRDRSASASGTEHDRRGGDVETRRKLASMTRECEKLNLKTQTLEDLVRDKAENNFDKLKREADLKTKKADELIAALKQELAVMRKSWSSSSSTSESVQAELSLLREAYENSQQDNVRLAQEVAAAKQSLHGVENERKALEAKLVAARQQLSSDTIDSKSGRNVGVKTTEAQREAKMKESLYTDLTGLIIRGVKRKDGEDEYDCIQTGRNGTLHFHLSVANEVTGSHPKTPGLSYEEAEFSYEPLLDDSRDRDLLEVLPDYLCEDICFPRNHAIKFYAKVMESMSRRVVVEDE